MDIRKKYIVDEKGNPKEVVIPIKAFEKIEELLGWDLDKGTIEGLRRARKDRELGKKDAYIELDSLR
jgi:predicted transposase YbfD/YdcC